jgi:hypothetical protein
MPPVSYLGSNDDVYDLSLSSYQSLLPRALRFVSFKVKPYVINGHNGSSEGCSLDMQDMVILGYSTKTRDWFRDVGSPKQ